MIVFLIEWSIEFIDIADIDDPVDGDMLALISLASRHFYHNHVEEHDLEVERGVAAGLAATLRTSLMIHPLRSNHGESYHKELDDVQGLHVAILASSLAMVIRCSEGVLAKHVDNFQHDLVVAMKRMTEIFSMWKGDTTIQQVASTSTIKMIQCIKPYAHKISSELVEILLKIVQSHSIATDIRLDAALTVCKFLNHKDGSTPTSAESLSPLMAMVEKHASVLISTLSTASLVSSHDEKLANPEDSMTALYKLAAVSSIFRCKMVKRRCTILSVVKHLGHPLVAMRERAMDFLLDVFLHTDSVESMLVSHGGAGDNFDLVRTAVIESVQDEATHRLRQKAVSLLRQLLVVHPHDSHCVMAELKGLAYGAEQDDIVMDSATAFLLGIRNQPTNEINDFLWSVVDFTTFPYAKVRTDALETIERVTASPGCVAALLNDTDLLENFGLIIRHGSDSDCEQALNIVWQVARSSLRHDCLCQASFLGAVVEFVTRDNVKQRRAHLYAVETLLALLSNPDTTKAFLSFRDQPR